MENDKMDSLKKPPKFVEKRILSAEKTLDPAHRMGVLLVENELSVSYVLAKMLMASGHRVYIAANGQEALYFYNQNSDHIDVVLTDLCMPNMDGRELCFQLKEQNPNLPIVVMTGYEMPPRSDHKFWSSIDGFLHKPMFMNELEAILQAI
jgi:CheY-like chemotaxis protein